MLLVLRNPHSVLEALRSRSEDVQEVRLSQRSPRDVWKQVADEASAAGVPVRVTPAGDDRKKPQRSGGKAGRAGAAEAQVRERPPVNPDDLFASAEHSNGVWLALDQIQDPHNLGAIFRSAAFFDVRGIVVTRHKSAPMTSVVYDVASGGVEHVPFSIVTNLRQALDAAKVSGLWVLGTSEHMERSVWEVPRDRNWLVVLGNEESGLRRLTSETCDELCGIPNAGGIGSLNVSVAAGVLMAALCRANE